MLLQEQATNKPRYFRFVLFEQNNRVEYGILGSDQEHYYRVQMHNGRAIACFDHTGEKCKSRHFHPGVPCKHMEQANFHEQTRRMRKHAEETTQKLPEHVQDTVREEVAKCQNAFEVAMQQEIDAEPGTPAWWKQANKRRKTAGKAYRAQARKSQEVVTAAFEEVSA